MKTSELLHLLAQPITPQATADWSAQMVLAHLHACAAVWGDTSATIV